METLYTKNHTWVHFLPNGNAQIGVTQYLVDTQKDPSFLNLCDEGDKIRAGDWLGDIEFFKGVTDILSPVSGTVERINETLCISPALLQDADTWIVELSDVSRDGVLWTKDEYNQYFTRGKP